MSLILIAHNISNLAENSDYNYEVLVGDGTPQRSRTIVKGKITGHLRSKGWKELVKRIVDESEDD